MASKQREQEKNRKHLSTDIILFSVWKKAKNRKFTRTILFLEIHDASEGANPGAHSSPVVVLPVLSGPQVVLPALVVGLVVHQPVAVHHVAGVDVGHAETVLDIGAVVAQLHHLTSHIRAIIQPHLVVATVLWRQRMNLKVTYGFQKFVRQVCEEKIPQEESYYIYILTMGIIRQDLMFIPIMRM